MRRVILLNFIHYSDSIVSVMASQITSVLIVYSAIYSGADQRKHQSFASLAFVRGIHQWLVNFLHKGPVTRKIFPFDDIIMSTFDNIIYMGPDTPFHWQNVVVILQWSYTSKFSRFLCVWHSMVLQWWIWKKKILWSIQHCVQCNRHKGIWQST